MFAPARSRSARHHSRQVRTAALALLLLSAAPAVIAQDQQPNSATIQWAQQVLDQQGFYQGRASGKMDSATAAAIAAYQKKQGLKSTGRLDAGTISRMMESQPERKGVGNLADPGSRAKASQPMGLREADVKPQAAPVAAAVDRGQGSETTVLGVSRGGADLAPTARTAPVTAPPATIGGTLPPAAGPAPSGISGGSTDPAAAPRSSVETEVTLEAPGEEGFDPARLPDWVRYGLIGGIGALLVGMLGFWWGSGRRTVKPAAKAAKGRRAAPPPASAGPVRREPTLGGTPPVPNGRREPVFSAPARDPGRVG